MLNDEIIASTNQPRRGLCAPQNITAREDVTAWTGGLGLLMNNTFQANALTLRNASVAR